MGSFKKLKSSDVITVPVVANKQWNFNYCPIPQSDPYIKICNGVYKTGAFTPGEEVISNGQYDRLTYDQINQLFYHKYTNKLNTSSLASSLYYVSASSQRPTSSYFNFNDNPAFINNFPTAYGSTIKVLYVSTQLYGQRILPYSFIMTSSLYGFIDDGKGNIYDVDIDGLTSYVVDGYILPGYFVSTEVTSSIHVGNIFYPEGIIVITNSSYQDIFPLPPVAFDDNYNFIRSDYSNPVTVSVSPLTNDDLRGNTLVNQSIQLFGGDIQFFKTGSNNTVSMSFEGLGVGTYQTNYTFQVTGSYCSPLTSNTGSIVINITDPDCEFEMSVATFSQAILAKPLISGSEIVIVLEDYSGSLG
jgi:hypothetical protein